MMSSSMRRLMWRLVLGNGGRPRLGLSKSLADFSPTKCANTSFAGRALSNHFAPASGFSVSVSSGFALRGIAFSFSLVGSSQTDHMDPSFSGCEDQHVQMFTDESQCLKPVFKIILTKVLQNQSAVPLKILHVCKINSSQQAVAIRFVGIERIGAQLLYPQYSCI